jgi:hypothetical protein
MVTRRGRSQSMTRRIAVLAVLTVFAATTAFGIGGNVDWKHDFDAAKAEAKKTGKPILLDFGGNW